MAAGAVLVVIIVLVVGVRGCLNSQKQDSLRSYNRDVGALVEESDNQVGKPFFEAMSGGTASTTAGGNQALDLQTTVNQLSATADSLVKRAKKLDVPGDMTAAQTNLLLTLTLRRDAIAKVADKLPTALGNTGADQAVAQIAGEMSVLLGFDVVYSQRVKPLIEQTLSEAGVNGQTVVSSRFLPNITWVDEATAARISAPRSAARRRPPARSRPARTATAWTPSRSTAPTSRPTRRTASPPGLTSPSR